MWCALVNMELGCREQFTLRQCTTQQQGPRCLAKACSTLLHSEHVSRSCTPLGVLCRRLYCPGSMRRCCPCLHVLYSTSSSGYSHSQTTHQWLMLERLLCRAKGRAV